MNQPDSPNRNVPVPSNAAGAPALLSERMLLVREANPTNNLRDYLSIFFKHKISIIASFLALSAIGIALVFVYKTWIYTPRYQATSSILVKFGWENYSPDLSPGNQQLINQGDMLGSEVTILEGRDLKDKVISALTPETIFPRLAKAKYNGTNRHDAALMFLDRNLVVKPEQRSNIIDVTFNGSNPESAAAVVNQLVKCYIDKRAEIYKDPKSVLFLQNKVDDYRQKLAESQNSLNAFRERTKIISFDQQRNMLLKRHSELIVALNNTANTIKEVQQKIMELKKEISSIPKTELTAGVSDRVGDAQSRLLGLKLQEQSLLAKYKDNNPLIANVRAQIEMVKQYLKENSADKPGVAPADPIFQDIQKQILNNRAQLSALNVRYTGTQKQIAELNAEIQNFEANENQYKTLAAAVSSNEERYNDYRRKLEQARVYDELGRDKMTSVSVIEPASAPIAPVNPPKPLILLLAAAIGVALVGSLGIAYMRELQKQVISTTMEAEKRLDLPVLITIPIKN